MYTYDRSLPKKHLEYDPTKYISCQKIPVFNSVTSFADCPSTHPSASFSLLMDDPTMDKSFDINTYVFVERNTSLAPGEIGLFFFNGKILIRKFSLQRTTPVLKTDYEELGKIFVREHDEFYIIGKIVR